MSPVTWLGEARDGDAVALRVGRDGDELVAEWLGTATLRVRRDGSDVRFVPMPDAALIAVDKLRRGTVRLLLRQVEGKLGLHGASVATKDGAVVIVGASGDGKSTLAAALCARGAELLADDATAIDRTDDSWVVPPFEDTHWLDAAARERIGLHGEGETDASPEKVAVPASRVARAPSPARSVIVLSFSSIDSPRLVLLNGVDAMAALVPLVMRLVVDDPVVQRRELDTLAELITSVQVLRLERPRDLACLGQACDLVLGTLAP